MTHIKRTSARTWRLFKIPITRQKRIRTRNMTPPVRNQNLRLVIFVTLTEQKQKWRASKQVNFSQF